MKVPHQKTIPGWTEFVKPFKDDACFWHAIWVSCGKPINCQVFYVMKRTRNIYHFAIRRVKNNIESIKNEKFLEASFQKKTQRAFARV